VLGELYIAQRGNGATLNGKSIHVSKTPALKDALLTTGFGYSTQIRDAVLAFERASLASRAIRRPGSAALDLAYTASGVFDGYWERDLKPWDIMAGILLVQEAGGTVTDLTGAKMTATTPDVAATNGPLHQELLSLVRLPTSG
jgi:myo-inositol-1(or 4)-monophosphatase